MAATPGLAQAATFPKNDDFVRQGVVVTNEGGLPASASMATATSEPGEPSHGATGPFRSAWWSWTAPRSGLAEAQTCSKALTPLLGLYTGFDVAQLTAVPTTPGPARCQLASATGSGVQLRFQAVEGTTYRIATATESPGEGFTSVAVQLQPQGDDFADPAPLPFPDDYEQQDLALGLSTAQPGEPAHGGRPTVHSTWFAYTPIRRERVRIEACNANYTPLGSTVTIYRGATLATLTEVASSRDAAPCGDTRRAGQVEAVVDAGVAYRIAITQDDPTVEPVTVRMTRSPPDDSATTPSKLAGYVDLALATKEPGEPDHAGHPGGRSRWRVITPDVSTTYDISSCTTTSAPTDSLLAVYEGAPGTPADALTPVVANDDGCATGTGSRVRFRALAGHRYLLAIDAKTAGIVSLSIARSPPNDNRDEATRFESRSPSYETQTALATAEPGEPSHAGAPATHSVWYRWVAPRSGNARIALCGATFDAVVAVYGVDPSQPALASAGATAGCSDPGFANNATGPHFDMAVTGGRTYLVAVDGRNGATGLTGALTMTIGTPLNDDLDDATSLADPTDATSATLGGTSSATAQPGEPAHAGRAAEHTSWWRWTSTRTGFVTLSACQTYPATGADTTLAVYTGGGVAGLQPVAAADAGCETAGGAANAKLSFYAVEGTIYRIATDVHGSTINAGVTLSLPAGNDRFDHALDITDYGSGSSAAATREPGEPDHAGRAGGRSLWYAWTPARSGLVELSTCGLVDTLLGVYTGTAVASLHEVASNDDAPPGRCEYPGGSAVRVAVEAGARYMIAVDGKDGAIGTPGVYVRTADAADRFATAAKLDPRPRTTSVDLSLTGAEPGEPSHAGRPAVRSTWLRFTPASTFVVEASSCSETADTVLAAYTGGDVGTLTPVASASGGGACANGHSGALLRFKALAGVTYSIAVDASAPGFGSVDFKLLPANDNLADALDLALAPGTFVEDTLRGSTRESGEPEHGAGPTAVSVWYRVRVASARTIRLSACPANSSLGSSARLAGYTGGSIGGLQPLAGAVSSPCAKGLAGGRLAFTAQPGSDVLVAVAAPAVGGDYRLTVEDVPPNDLFAAANVIADGGGSEYAGETAHAGKEPGEPRHAGRPGGHSLWWRYTPATDRVVDVHACTETSDPLLAVYTGAAVDALTPVAIGIKDDFECADMTFTARAGVTYRLALDVDGGGPGTMRFALAPDLPDHESFAAAQPVAIPSSNVYDLVRAAPEPGEPVHAGLGRTHSVWFRLNPDRDEILDISSCGVNFANTVVAVYTGASVDALTEVASNDESSGAICTFGSRDAHVAVPVRAGTVYWVAVDEAIGTGDRSFDLFVSRRAPHDAFADPFSLVPGTPVEAFTGIAGAEPGEPAHDGVKAAHSVWAAWTAQRSGRAVVEACGADYAGMHLGAYTGDRVDGLTPVASSDDSPACPGAFPAGARVELDVVAGQRYHVAADERFGYTSARVTLHVAPPNDDRAAAFELPAPGAGADVDLSAAGLEAGEPRHAGVRRGRVGLVPGHAYGDRRA